MDRSQRISFVLILSLLGSWQLSWLRPCRAEGEAEPKLSHAEIDTEFNKTVFDDSHPEAELLSKFRMQFVLTRKLQQLGATCRLSQQQFQKIASAGNGDIARACDRIQAARSRYHKLAADPDAASGVEELDSELGILAELVSSAQWPLQRDGSLFEKSCNTILSDQQKLQTQLKEPPKLDPAPRARLRPFIDVRYLFLMADPRKPAMSKVYLKEIISEETRPYFGNSHTSKPSKIPRPPNLSAQVITIGDSEELTHVVGEQGIVELMGKAELRSFESESQLACVAEKKVRDGTSHQLMAGCEIIGEVLPKRQVRLKICLGAGQISTPATDRAGLKPEIDIQQCELVAGAHQLLVVRGFRLARRPGNQPSSREREPSASIRGRKADEDSLELIVILFPRIIERGGR